MHLVSSRPIRRGFRVALSYIERATEVEGSFYRNAQLRKDSLPAACLSGRQGRQARQACPKASVERARNDNPFAGVQTRKSYIVIVIVMVIPPLAF